MAAKPDLKVVELYDSNISDPAATLRKIADGIDRGTYGDVSTVGLVMLGDEMEVFGFGADSEAPTVALLLHAGFMRLSRSIEEYGR